MEKVSVIVPIYNASKYLNECLDSLVNQIYTNFEVLLIDDGSIDNSRAICSSYLSDMRFKYYYQNNSGVSSARNKGIDLACGKYIMFVDSDDIVDSMFIYKMVESVADCEMAVCNYNILLKSSNFSTDYMDVGKFKSVDVKPLLFNEKSIRGFSCNKIFLRSIINDNNIRFNNDIKICEDLLFCFQYVNCINDVTIINDGLYYYRMRKSSAVNLKSKRDLTVFDAFNRMYQLDSNVYIYAKQLYTYLYFKYYRSLKKESVNVANKISLFSFLVDKDFSILTKLKFVVRPYINGSVSNLFNKYKKRGYFE